MLRGHLDRKKNVASTEGNVTTYKKQTSPLLTVRATFLQIKHRNRELEGKLQQDFKIPLSNYKKQSTYVCSSTILHTLFVVKVVKAAQIFSR